jgi:ABC-type multidrug transport system fused ATPase/permease subunit
MNTLRGKTGWIVALLGVVALLDYVWISPANQTYAKRYLNESIVLSASTYATCRVINGGVSSLQESSISISPWGVGLEYEAGQILDPINDAVERLSGACVHSMALLGAQRIVLGIINQYGIFPFYFALVVFLGLALWGKGSRFARLSGRVALILLLLRISTPVLCFLGTSLNHQYFDPRIEKHAAELTKVRELAWAEFETETPQLSQPTGQFSDPLSILPDFFREIGRKVAGYSQWMKKRAEALSEALAYLRDNFTEIMESMTALFVLVLEKIILLAILLPIGLLYCLRKAYRWLAEEELDQWIRTLFDPSSAVEAEEKKS